jgi:hypothetical protein
VQHRALQRAGGRVEHCARVRPGESEKTMKVVELAQSTGSGR